MKKFSIALFVLSIAIVYSTACNNSSEKGNVKIEKASDSIAMLPIVFASSDDEKYQAKKLLAFTLFFFI